MLGVTAFRAARLLASPPGPAMGLTDWFPSYQEDLAAEEGWIHVPSCGHEVAPLGVR